MTSVSSEAWFPVATLIAGFLTKSLADYFQDRRVTQRAREARDDERRSKAKEVSNIFQQDNLLNLQEEMMKLMRLPAQAHHHDVMESRRGTAWKKTFLPDGVSENVRASQARTALLTARVRDETVREMAEQVKSNLSESIFASSEREAQAALDKASFEWRALNERIGSVLRHLSDE